LTSQDPKARLLAAEGLEWVGEPSRSATPALVRLLDDPDEQVRRQAEQTLFRVDPVAAADAGVVWTRWDGITRQSR
jgi:HEAT repeat protein